MKKFLPAILFVFTFAILIPVLGVAQNVGINADGSRPDSSAMLDVSSTTKGFLPPRMTEAQKNLIGKPANGLIIYQTDDVTGLYVNKGTSSVPNWQLIGPAVPVASPSFFFNTDQPVVNSNYIGLGTSGSSFLKYTSVVPIDCVLKSIALSTRNTFSSATTATVWLQTPVYPIPVATTLVATIISGSFSVASGTLAVNAGDLISVRIFTPGGGLPNGVAVSVTYQ